MTVKCWTYEELEKLLETFQVERRMQGYGSLFEARAFLRWMRLNGKAK